MLSIAAMGHGQGAYYTELAQEDYYTHGGEPPGIWFGRGAEALSLEGRVDKEQLHRLLEGFMPDGHTPLVQNAGERLHRPGCDLTFSAPKSVSTLWSQADDATRLAVQEAHLAAVKVALGYLEQTACYSRQGKGGTKTLPARPLFAMFEHGTSRAQDPQLHTHALLVNVAMCDDGRTRAVLSRPVYRHKMAAGALYRTELARQLYQHLGLEPELRKHHFEVAGVPKSLLDAFSQRRQEILAALNERGLVSAKAAATAALDTRHAKEHAPRAELFATWRRIGAEHGFAEAEVRRLICGPRPDRSGNVDMDALVRNAVEQLTKQESHFRARDVVRGVAEAAQGLRIGGETVLAAVHGYLATPRKTVHLGRWGLEDWYTTPEMLAVENRVLSSASALSQRPGSRVSRTSLAAVIAARAGLSDEQKQALRHVISDTGAISVVSGLAGTGKTTVLDAARDAWERNGYRVVGTALAGKAALGLEESAGIESVTIARFLMEQEKGFDDKPDLRRKIAAEWKHATWQIDGKTRKKMLGEYHKPTSRLAHAWKYATWQISAKHRDYLDYQLERQKLRLDKKTVLVVDEAGMVGTRLMDALISCVERAGAKLVLVGDERQLQPIEAGGPFKAIGDRVGRATLKDIQRQREPWARDAAKQLAEGRAREWLKAYAERGFLLVADDRHAAMDALIKQWARDCVSRAEGALIFCGTRADAASLNRMAQTERRARGALGNASIRVQDELLCAGDRVLFTRNSRLYGVNNGTLGTVEKVDVRGRALTVRVDSGTRTTVSLDHYDHVKLGYAVTTHKGQGATVDRAYVLLGGSMQTRELTYVQASRARNETQFYTDRRTAGEGLADLLRAIETSRQKSMAVDVNAQHVTPRPRQRL